MTQYKLYKNHLTNQHTCVVRTDPNGQTFGIPLANDNTDYQAYLKWVSEGNTPEPADEE
jgi:hypothetical protein